MWSNFSAVYRLLTHRIAKKHKVSGSTPVLGMEYVNFLPLLLVAVCGVEHSLKTSSLFVKISCFIHLVVNCGLFLNPYT